MSDYIDKVDIEGTQYDIQDTPTKQNLENLIDTQDFSTEEVNTGVKYTNGKDIYKKYLIFPATILTTNAFTPVTNVGALNIEFLIFTACYQSSETAGRVVSVMPARILGDGSLGLASLFGTWFTLQVNACQIWYTKRS